jgi:putative ABC transport system permease protein
MRYFTIFRVAFRALRRNKLRTVLTMLGIIFGVGAVIAMVALGNGARARVEASIASLGQNLILVYSGNNNTRGVRSGFGGAGTLTIDDSAAIEKEVPGVVAISPEVRSMSQIMAGNNNWYTSVVGEGLEYLNIREWDLDEGEMFTEADVRAANKVCIIGKTIATQLFGEEDPVGKIIRIRNVPTKILGVLKSKGFSVQGNDQDDTIIVPYTTAMKRISGTTNLRGINVQVSGPEVLAQAQSSIIDLLRQRHRVQNAQDDDFTVRNQQEIADTSNAATDTMRKLLAGVAVISLLVGGIGIMNIMLVSVTERTREIGIRMSVGARSRDILLQFLIEAVALSSTGGLLGILSGIGAAKLMTVLQQWPTQVSNDSVLIAFIFSAAVGVFFGYYPARKASQLDPIDALRYE